MIPIIIKFWSYLIFLIPSIICSLFILYYLLVRRTPRHALNNHVIILLLLLGLICEVTNYPWMLYYYYYDGVWERSPMFCTIWAFLDWAIYATQTMLFAWATIERHFLIFHDQWLSTRKKRFFIHYLPPIVLLLYCLVFYIIVDFFPPCENIQFDVDMICVYFCLYGTYQLYMWQTIVHQILPNLVIVLFSIALAVRILWQKHRMHQPIYWRRHRKMTVQLLSISFLYLIFSFPFILVTVMYLCGLLYSVYGDFLPYADFSSYFILLLFPFVCVLSLPELRAKIKNIFRFRRHARALGSAV
jgi:hypothetical protein